MRILSALILAPLLFIGVLHAEDIEGLYSFKGWNPYVKSNYTGTAVITKGESEVYEAEWIQGNRKFTGTGLKSGNKISFIVTGPPLGTFFGETEKAIFLIVYKISGKKLKGSWVRLHNTLIGTEEMHKK